MGHRINTVPYIPKELFHKYYSIAFAILPGIAGGLALELFNQYNDLFQVGQIITSEINYDLLFDVIIKQTNKIMDVERCSIFLVDEKSEMLNAFASAGIGGLSIKVPKMSGGKS